MINFSSDLANNATIKRFVKECPERFTDVIETAINRATARIRALVKKETPSRWGLSKEEMKDFKIKRATRKQAVLTATAILRGSNIKLFKFSGVSPRTLMTGKTTGGVTVMMAGQSHNFASAFIAQMKSGHIGIFHRTGKFKDKPGKRKPIVKREIIKELTSASVPGFTASEKTEIPARIAPMIQEEFENQFVRGAEAWLNLLGAK